MLACKRIKNCVTETRDSTESDPGAEHRSRIMQSASAETAQSKLKSMDVTYLIDARVSRAHGARSREPVGSQRMYGVTYVLQTN